jgi:hypothetical protein
MKDQIEKDLLAAVDVHQTILNEKLIHDQMANLAAACLSALRNGGKIIFAIMVEVLLTHSIYAQNLFQCSNSIEPLLLL